MEEMDLDQRSEEIQVSDESPERHLSRDSSPRPPTVILWDEDEPLDPLPDPEDSLRPPMYKALYEHWRYEEPLPIPEQDPSKIPAIPLGDADDSDTQANTAEHQSRPPKASQIQLTHGCS